MKIYKNAILTEESNEIELMTVQSKTLKYEPWLSARVAEKNSQHHSP